MKVFISADIEGVATTTLWDHTTPSHPSYGPHAKRMTDEALAAVQGAKNAGATEIVIKDAHGPGTNIDPSRMPSGVTLLRNWSGHPYCMAQGVDKSFDAAMFIGYHSAAGRAGNPMSHTISGGNAYIKINGAYASEFLLYSWACALEGVPTVFLSGDKMLCDDSAGLHPLLVVCPVKDGLGAMTINYSPDDMTAKIAELSETALKQDLGKALVTLPDHFEAEIFFKEHVKAEKASWFPGVELVSANIVKYSSDSFFEILRTTIWII